MVLRSPRLPCRAWQNKASDSRPRSQSILSRIPLWQRRFAASPEPASHSTAPVQLYLGSSSVPAASWPCHHAELSLCSALCATGRAKGWLSPPPQQNLVLHTSHALVRGGLQQCLFKLYPTHAVPIFQSHQSIESFLLTPSCSSPLLPLSLYIHMLKLSGS